MSDPFTPPPQQPQDPRQTPYQAPYAAPYQAPYQARPQAPYGGAYAPQGTHRSGWFWVAVTVGIIGVVAIAICLMMASMVKTLGMDANGGSMDFGGDSIAVIDIAGVITDADTDALDKQLERFGK